jgi:preprotein translocase subunit SecA
VLNAKNHEHEGEIVAQAGKVGSVVIATNMAGRGVDIKLGGNPCTKEEEQEVKDKGGLFVLGTERHDARRIDDQLRGRAGRQGDPGETQFFVSMDDPIMKIFGGDRIKTLVGSLGLDPNEAIQNKTISRQLEKAQEKVEGFHFDSRKSTLDYDNVLSYQRNMVYERRQKILLGDEDYYQEIYDRVIALDPELAKDIKGKQEEVPEKVFKEVFRKIALHVNDQLWMQHLQVMDYTRSSVSLRAYGQREPLIEYKKEGLRLFNEMQENFNQRVADMMARVDIKALSQQSPLSETKKASVLDDGMIEIIKEGEVRRVKEKMLSTYLDAGWKERGE